MKLNEDGKTVRAMDVLFPQIGEIIGGSEREADYDKLQTRIQEMDLPMKDICHRHAKHPRRHPLPQNAKECRLLSLHSSQ